MFQLEAMKELKAGHPRYAVISGNLNLGTVELFRKPSHWVWRLTKFHGDMPGHIQRSGKASNRDNALKAIQFAWDRFQSIAAAGAGKVSHQA